MEIQNLKRRNSEYVLTKSQRERESQRQQTILGNLIKKAMQEVAQNLKNMKRRCNQEEKTGTQ